MQGGKFGSQKEIARNFSSEINNTLWKSTTTKQQDKILFKNLLTSDTNITRDINKKNFCESIDENQEKNKTFHNAKLNNQKKYFLII